MYTAGRLGDTSGFTDSTHVAANRKIDEIVASAGSKRKIPSEMEIAQRYKLLTLLTLLTPGLHESLQPCSRAARKWRENEEMRRKWRENEEMERD